MVYTSAYEKEFLWCSKDERCPKSAHCKWCGKSFKIDSMGRSAFISHAEGKRHKKYEQLNKQTTPINSFLQRESTCTLDSIGHSKILFESTNTLSKFYLFYIVYLPSIM